MTNIHDTFKEAGAEAEDNVEVNISYDIIRHVSAQLYTNPRKAIEELVCNSYDAGAKNCWIRLPNDEEDSLAVLDDGVSMDLDGIKNLWKVASSSKVTDDGEPKVENNRRQIGKFGVGKLAAYALGKRLTHVACIGSDVRVISVGQSEIKEQEGGGSPTFQVFKMQISDAIPLIDPLFEGLPKPWEAGISSWTFALVEQVVPESRQQALKIGILKRMIKTALPVSAEFKVFLEGEEVPPYVIPERDIEITVEITDEELRGKIEDALRAYWKDVLEEESLDDVPEKYYKLKVKEVPDPQNIDNLKPAIIVPGLGQVMGNAIITKTKLTPEKQIERGYSQNGFAVYASGKLVNPEDPLFGISQRSHAFWRRFLARVEIPSLYKVLLVQRNDVSETTPEAPISREILRTLFNLARTRAADFEEETEYVPKQFGNRLRTLMPILAPIALRGLAEEDMPPGGLSGLAIEFSSLGETGPPAFYDREKRVMVINEDHPLMEALNDLGSKARAMRHLLGEVLAGTQLVSGYLTAQEVDPGIVKETQEITEASLQSAAGFIRDPVEELIEEIRDASHEGGTPFENAVVRAFKTMRLSAKHVGGPDAPDGIIEIERSGTHNLRISIEAKGSSGVITHTELSEASVSRHSREYDKERGCDGAIAIAREFQTEGIGNKEAALLRETKGKVPLLTVDAIAKLLRLHSKRPFTNDKVEEILTTWNDPDKVEDFIEDVWNKMPELGLMRLILTVAHELVSRDDTNFPDPGMLAGDKRIRERRIEKEKIRQILVAIQISTEMIDIKDTSTFEFKLLAPPETILEALQKDFKDGQDGATEVEKPSKEDANETEKG